MISVEHVLITAVNTGGVSSNARRVGFCALWVVYGSGSGGVLTFRLYDTPP